ncbi:F-box protein PP2-B11-like [Curcuma longa]|uniref:F-box protein PP2-B11-like n=1 Tax=Curcuma longa TaxID=136217 RepID=UPI003D9DB4E3
MATATTAVTGGVTSVEHKKRRHGAQQQDGSSSAVAHGLLLDQFPTDVLAQILAFTSPLDAARSSAVSHNFRSAAASDAVWDRFLPPDIDAILSRAIAPVEFPSKKDLFLRLSARPILIDGGDASFALERSSSKKCLMLSARQLRIAWGDDARYWTFTPTHESRFGEVAELLAVWWFDLSGVIATTSLSPRATYGAFLVFQLREHAAGFRSPAQEASVHVGAQAAETLVALQRPRRGMMIGAEEVRTPRRREDGWMEIEMGRFLNDHEDGSTVHVRFHQVREMNYKTGLIVQGIEFRPVISQ